MLNEIKILHKNIQKLRKFILSEDVSKNTITDAISHHKIIYMYYAGDDTILKGYRTIRPFVLGTHKKTGNIVLRAWQDAGSSDSYRGLNRTPRKGHEIHNGPKGTQPGWRLFRIDAITSFLPTGEEFEPREFFNVGGVKYNPNDKDMSDIIKSIEITPQTGMGISGTDSIDDPEITSTKFKDREFDVQTSKFKQFFKAAEKTRNATKEEIKYWWDIVKKQRKKSPRNYWMIQNEKGDMVLVTDNAVKNDRIKPESIVGNLQDLYNEFIVEPQPYKNDFAKDRENLLKNKLKNKSK